MKTYDVTIRAIIYKTITVEAEDEDAACDEASELFSVMPDGTERYEEEAIGIEEVQ